MLYQKNKKTFLETARRWFIFRIIQRFYYRIWALRYNQINFVVDTCAFLSSREMDRLVCLKNIWVPRSVWQQIGRMINPASASVDESDEEDYLVLKTPQKSEILVNKTKEAAQRAEAIMRKKLTLRQWKIISSRGTGIVGWLSHRKINELDPEIKKQLQTLLKKRSQKFDIEMTLGDLVGSTDLRILAVAIFLLRRKKMENKLIVISEDRILSLIARNQGLKVLRTTADL